MIRRALKRTAERLGYHLASRREYDLVRRDYYSPLADPAELAAAHFERPSALRGLELDPDAELAFAEAELAQFIREMSPPLEAPGDDGIYYAYNGNFDSVDGELAYAFVRRFRPARVIELGSGFSTLALAQACARNAADGAPVQYVVCDPFPRGNVPAGLEGITELRAVRAQDVAAEEIAALRAGDVLFVDTSHTVKAGGDVNHVVLDVLPELAPGVLVHFHDVFLPWDYHRAWIEYGRAWAEQYLLQAFLAFNERFEIVFAAHAVARAHPERLAGLVPSYDGRSQPTSFWLRRL